MNKDTQVEIIYPSNFWWKHTMSDIGYAEGMTEEELNAKISDFLNNDEFETWFIPESNELKIYPE
jgi:hypothetical protein